ncbi:MAG: ABC transporter permease [Anaerolineales bacterium]|nr:ABC transporter permease [Anaerolineales bacterium]
MATFLSIGITNQAALNSIVTLFENTSGKTQLMVTSASNDQGGFSETLHGVVENYPGIQAAAPSISVFSVLSNEVVAETMTFGIFGASTEGLQLNGIDPVNEQSLREYTITEGTFFNENSHNHEVILVDDYAADKSIQVGDWIGILTPNGVAQIRVLGLIAREGPGQTNNGAFGILPLSVVQELFNRVGEIDQIDLLSDQSNPPETELELLKNNLQQRLGDDVTISYPSARGDRMTQMLQSYQIGLNFMSGVALFVGAFLIYNSFAMTVIERTREFGMLRTIGMTRRQITGLVMIEAGILGGLGSFLGLFVGMLLAQGLTQLMEVVLNQSLVGIETPLENLISSWLIGVAVTFLASGIPAWKAGRISPMEALSVRARSNEGWLIWNGWKVGLVLFLFSAVLLIINPFPYDVQFRLGSFTVFGLFGGVTLLIPSTIGIWENAGRPAIKLLFGASGDLGARNVRRSRQRTTLTVAAMMVGVAMVVITRGMTESFAGDLQEWINAYIGGDIYTSSSIPMRVDIGQRIDSVPGVKAVTPIRYLSIDWQQPNGEIEEINFMAIDPATYTQVTEILFSDENTSYDAVLREFQKGGGVFISTVLAEKYDLSPGDVVRLRTRTGYKAFNVIAVVVDFYNQGVVVQGNWDDMRRYFRVNDASTFLVGVDQAYAVAEVLENIDELYGQRYRLVLESNESIRSRIQNLMDQAFSMFDVMALISVVVGCLGIVNTLTMSVIERTKEIGMLRAIGTTRSQIVQMVLAEGMLMGILGGILGLFTGMILARIIFIGMTTMSGYQLTFVMPLGGVIFSFVGALIISLIAALFPARRAANIQILEAVHYE